MTRILRRFRNVSRRVLARRPGTPDAAEVPCLEPLERRELMSAGFGWQDPFYPVYTAQNGELRVDGTFYGRQGGFQLAGFSSTDLGVGVYGSFLPNLADNSITSSAALVGNSTRPYGIPATNSLNPHQIASILGVDPNNPGQTTSGAAFRIYQDVLRQVGTPVIGPVSTPTPAATPAPRRAPAPPPAPVTAAPGATVSNGVIRGSSSTWQGFGLGQAQTLNYRNSSARIDLIGEGAGLAIEIMPGYVDILVVGSTEKSWLDITTNGEDLAIRDVIVIGSLQGFDAPTSNLFGGLGITGSAQWIVLDDVVSATMVVGEPHSRGKLLNLDLHAVRDLTIDSRAPIGSLITVDWDDTDAVRDVVRAPSIKTLLATAEDNFHGDFGASLVLQGTPRGKYTLDTAIILGDATQSAWLVNGSVKKVSVLGQADGFHLVSARDIKDLFIVDSDHVTVAAAGTVNKVLMGDWDSGVLLAPSVKSLTVVDHFGANVLAPKLNGRAGSLGKVFVGDLSGIWMVNGSIKQVQAGSVAGGFMAAVTGDVKKFSVYGDMSGGIAAGSLGSVIIGGDLRNAAILAGGFLDSGSLKQLRIGGDVLDATVRVGLAATDGIYDNGNDVILGGSRSALKSLTIGGSIDSDSLFIAGKLPKTITLDGTRMNPLADGRFRDHPVVRSSSGISMIRTLG